MVNNVPSSYTDDRPLSSCYGSNGRFQSAWREGRSGGQWIYIYIRVEFILVNFFFLISPQSKTIPGPTTIETSCPISIHGPSASLPRQLALAALVSAPCSLLIFHFSLSLSVNYPVALHNLRLDRDRQSTNRPCLFFSFFFFQLK